VAQEYQVEERVLGANKNIFKQLLQIIQNKRTITKGVIRRPLESADGFVSNLYNYELTDGVARNRLGTRVMNTQGNEMWYKIDSFKMSDMDVVIGINFKREVWAWLDKWPEVNFRLCNSSPFRRYTRRTISGSTADTRQLIFSRGNKFWLEEDNLSIIIINDYGDIQRIMKKGCVRFEDDDLEYITGRRSNTYKTEAVLRLYVDIKDATNKVFNDQFYLKKDNKKRGWRISGDTRMAYVNEMNIVSELSERIELDGYQHVMASIFPLLDMDANRFAINVKDIVKDGAIASNGCDIYQGQWKLPDGSLEIAATSGNAWDLDDYWTEALTTADAVAIVVDGDSGTEGSTSWSHPLPTGVYLCINTLNKWRLDTDEADAGQFVNLNMHTESGDINLKYQPKRVHKDFQRVQRPSTTTIQPLDTSNGTALVYSAILTYDADTEWITLSDTVPPQLRNYLRSVHINDGVEWMKFNGCFLQVNTPLNLRYFNGKYLFTKSDTIGFEFPKYDGNAALLTQGSFDTWDYEGESEISIADDFIPDFLYSTPSSSVSADFDVAVKATGTEYFDKAKENNRLAIWNNDYIVAVGQRFFYDYKEKTIVYESDDAADVGYYNYDSSTKDLRIGASPVVAMDNTGIRKRALPLPLIRRAMRNPQELAIAGGQLFVVEDSKLWHGNASELMLTDFIELQSDVLDMAGFDNGVIVATKNGLFFLTEGTYKKVYNSDSVVVNFIASCSGGAIAVRGKDIYLVHKQVTENGAWYPSLMEIGTPITETNFVGHLKSVSIGDKIYLADDWNVWLFDITTKAWSGIWNYNAKIQQIFRHNNKLGLAFDSDIIKQNSFDTPLDLEG